MHFYKELYTPPQLLFINCCRMILHNIEVIEELLIKCIYMTIHHGNFVFKRFLTFVYYFHATIRLFAARNKTGESHIIFPRYLSFVLFVLFSYVFVFVFCFTPTAFEKSRSLLTWTSSHSNLRQACSLDYFHN